MTKTSDMLLQQSGIQNLDLPVAFDLLGKGELDLAAAVFTKLLQRQPRLAEAQFGLGQVAMKRNQLKEAAQYFSRAIQLKPGLADAYTSLGNVFQAMERFKQAADTYSKGLAAIPTFAPLHFNMGICLRRMGQHDAGITAFKNALALQPDHVLAMFSLGNAYRDNGETAQAQHYYEEAVRIRPDYADAQCNLGGLYSVQEEHAKALACFDAALRQMPLHFFALKNRSLSLFKLGRYSEGAENAMIALKMQPEDMMLHYHMGEMIYGLTRAGEAEAARRFAKAWTDGFPNNPVAQHMAAAAMGESVPSRADDTYVRETFDRFSGDFEKVLGNLEYRAPQLLEVKLKGLLGERGGLTVLDAGCGTGLCAPMLRPRSAKLVGVDLSPGMLQKAQARNLYNELHEAELGAFLRATADRYDLTLAADVFCYFGDLVPVLSDLAARMPSGALLAFTAERIDGDIPPTGYRLNPTGRYAHGDDYLRQSLQAAGFSVTELEETAARVEMGVPVPCYVVTATRA